MKRIRYDQLTEEQKERVWEWWNKSHSPSESVPPAFREYLMDRQGRVYAVENDGEIEQIA